MPLVVKDRVKETTTTTGTGTYTLAGAATGFQSFSVIGNGNTTYYTVTDNTNWEIGIGTYTSVGTTLSRDTILASSNAGSAVNWGAGSKDVFVTYPAGRSVYVDTTTITPGTTATLPATSGGTGLSSGTSGGVPYFSSSTTIASSAALTANALVIGGGAGVAPSTTTTGTGVVTALGTNVGTAGAFVVNGGALGTPSSGVVTNLTGTASININGTVGATTPTTGNFTALTATSAVVTGSAGVLTRAAATQDGVELIGRAGGTLSYKVTFTPTTLTASRTLTLPDASGTILQSGTAVTVAQGGTGITTGTSGGIPYFSSTSAIASSAALTANALVIGGGAGVAPSTTTTGTGVLTALGVNVGSSGAFTTNNAANTFTAAQTFRVANAIRSEAAATQDAVVIAGRAGGTTSLAVTLTPTTLTANRTLTLPDASGTILQSGTAVTVAQGGTGLTSGTAGGIPYFSTTTGIKSSGLLVADALMVGGGGAGAAPKTCTTGTGVLAALANSVGCTGAFTTNNATNVFSCPQTIQGGVLLQNAVSGVNDKLCLSSGCVGASSYVMTVCPDALTSSRFVSIPDFTGVLVGDINTQCVTNKQIVPRSSVQTGAIATLCPSPTTNDVWTVLGLSTAMSICGGSANDGEALLIRIQDNGTSRALTWASGALGYQAIGVTLPTATTINKMTYVCAIYNSCCTRWDVVQAQTQA
jgi:hypothetical protein